MLEWTKEPPTEPGWYWVRRYWRGPMLREVVDASDFFQAGVDESGLWIVTTPKGFCDECDATTGGASRATLAGWFFAGPIPEPKEPDDA